MGSLSKALLMLGGLLIHTCMANYSDSNTTLRERSRNDTPCKVYLIQGMDSCSSIAKAYDITTADIEKHNSKTYAWKGCDKLRQGDFICVNSGAPPMPAALPNAVCGPQVPGTKRPTFPEAWANLSSLNPCPVGQCCNEGQCQNGADSCGAAVGQATVAATSTKSSPTSYTTQRITVDTSKDSTTTTTTTSMSTTRKDKTTTTESKTTTTEKPEETADFFSIFIYRSKDCDPDGDYYAVEGHAIGFNQDCFGIHSGISNISTATNTYCNWYWNGGKNMSHCDFGDDISFKSIRVPAGMCNIFDTDDCQSNGMAQLYTYDDIRKNGCKNVDKAAPGVLAGMQCYKMV